MGLDPEDYYKMLPKHFAAKVEGYNRRVYNESSLQRKIAFIIISPHVKDLSYNTYCKELLPLQGDTEHVESDGFERTPSPEVWAEIMKHKKAREFETRLQDHNKKLSNVRRSTAGRSDRRQDTGRRARTK